LEEMLHLSSPHTFSEGILLKWLGLNIIASLALRIRKIPIEMHCLSLHERVKPLVMTRIVTRAITQSSVPTQNKAG